MSRCDAWAAVLTRARDGGPARCNRDDGHDGTHTVNNETWTVLSWHEQSLDAVRAVSAHLGALEPPGDPEPTAAPQPSTDANVPHLTVIGCSPEGAPSVWLFACDVGATRVYVSSAGGVAVVARNDGPAPPPARPQQGQDDAPAAPAPDAQESEGAPARCQAHAIVRGNPDLSNNDAWIYRCAASGRHGDNGHSTHYLPGHGLPVQRWYPSSEAAKQALERKSPPTPADTEGGASDA